MKLRTVVLGVMLLMVLTVPRSAMAQVEEAAAESDASAATFTMQNLPSLPDKEGFAGMFAGVSHGVLLAAGGANFPEAPPWEGGAKVWTDAIYVLAPVNDEPDAPLQWRVAEERLPRPLGYGVTVSYRDSVICIGGSDAERHYADVFAMRYEGGRIVFEELPPLPQPCAMMSGALVGTTVYVAGGLDAPNATAAMHTFWAMDLSVPAGERKWRTLEAWPGPGRHLSVSAGHEDSFYLFSGIVLEADEEGKPRRVSPYLTDAWRFTPGRDGTAGKWEKLSDVPRGVAAAPSPAVPISSTHLAVLGGDAQLLAIPPQDHPGFTRDVQVYNVESDTWVTQRDALPEGTSRVTAPTAYWHEGFVVVSGERAPGKRSPDVFHIKPAQVRFGTLNWVVLTVYLGGMVAIGLWCARREGTTTDDFFIAGGRIPWWAAGLSIFGTQLSAITFMTIPATAFAENWVRLTGNWMIAVVAPVVIIFYLPFYRRLNLSTAYEYLERRFNLVVRMVGSVTFIIFQFARIGIVLYLPALALSAVTGIDIYMCILLMGIVSAFYTVLGGMEAVIWTDVVQVVVLLGGAVLCVATVAIDVGGVGELMRIGAAHDKFHIFNWGWNPNEMTVWVMVVGCFFLNMVPYTTEQTVIQRYMTTRDEKQAARSIWTNGLLCIPTGLLFFLLGTALFVFYQKNAHAVTPVKTDQIVPWFVVHELPAGVAGLVIAGVFAAAMSSLDSSMNSVATAGINDFYRRFRPGVSDRHCLSVARWITIVVGAIGTASALVLATVDIRFIFDFFQTVLGFVGGALCGTFMLGIFTRRGNAAGALAGMVLGPVAIYAVMDTVHVFLYAAVGAMTSLIVGYVVSLAYPMPDRNLVGLTFFSRGRRAETVDAMA